MSNNKELTLDQKYEEARDKVAELIAIVNGLYQEEKTLKGLIAQWGLSYAHEDLVNLYHRLGNLKYTIRNKEKTMASGIKSSCNRPKSSKHLRGNSNKKRHKNSDSAAQAKYHAAIAARRAKKNKK